MRQRNLDLFDPARAQAQDGHARYNPLNSEAIVRLMSECITAVVRQGRLQCSGDVPAEAGHSTNPNDGTKEADDE